MRYRVGLIGQFSPPVHGLSKALDTLYNSKLNEKFHLTKISITNNKKFLFVLLRLIFSNFDLYYFTISQSKIGNIRDLIILKIIQLKHKPIIIHLHGGGFKNLYEAEFGSIQKYFNNIIFSKVDVAIVLGKSLLNMFDNVIDQNKLLVVNNCIDKEFLLDDIKFEKKISTINNDEIVKVLYLGNFIEEKGYKYVLDLAKHINDRNDKRFKFYFAGKFFTLKDKTEFESYVQDNSLNHMVEYKGIVLGEEKLKLLEECHCFVLLTTYKNEGQPISIIEAAANGLRVISTDHAGIKDILNEKEMIMIDKEEIDIEKIYKQLNYEIIHHEWVNDILKKNRKKMKTSFSEEQYIKNIEDVFLSVISNENKL